MSGNRVFAPIELWRIERGHLNHGQMNMAVIVNEFRTQRVGKAPNGMFRAAVGRLQGNRPIGERGAYLNDSSPVARMHPPECGHRAIHRSEICDFCRPLELLGRDFFQG